MKPISLFLSFALIAFVSVVTLTLSASADAETPPASEALPVGVSTLRMPVTAANLSGRPTPASTMTASSALPRSIVLGKKTIKLATSRCARITTTCWGST